MSFSLNRRTRRRRRGGSASFFGGVVGEKRARVDEGDDGEDGPLPPKPPIDPEKFMDSITCPVCFSLYCSVQDSKPSEVFDRTPMIVCNQGHSVCKDCSYRLRNIRPIKCPICRLDLLPSYIPNQSLKDLADSATGNVPEKKPEASASSSAAVNLIPPARPRAFTEDDEGFDPNLTLDLEEDLDDTDADSQIPPDMMLRVLLDADHDGVNLEIDPYQRQDNPVFNEFRDRIEEYWQQDGTDEQESDEDIRYDIGEAFNSDGDLDHLEMTLLDSLLNHGPNDRGDNYRNELRENRRIFIRMLAGVPGYEI